MKEFFPIIRSSQLFSGVSEEELTAMLSCLETRRESFPKDALLLRIGDTADAIGLVLSGSVLIIQEDIWGNRNIISKAGVGQTFAAAYACAPGSVGSAVRYEGGHIPARPALSAALRILPRIFGDQP